MIRPKKKNIFDMHEPLGLRYLLQLRVGLSFLRYHKKCHNFIDTPSDICLSSHGIEDINHFLLTLASSVIENLQKYNLNHLGNQSNLYLYGHQTINPFVNNKIDKRNSTFFNVRLPPPPPPPPHTHTQLLVLSQSQSHGYFVCM